MIKKPTNTAERSLKKFNFLLIAIFVMAIGAVAAFGAYSFIMQPKDPSSETLVDIVIPKGQSLSKTATVLYEKNLIRSPLSLKILAYTKSAKVQAGRFKLAANMSPQDIIEKLNTGKLDYWVTFLEGWRREQFAEALNVAAKDNNLEFNSAEFLSLTQGKEGYLFPDSYLFPLDTSVANIVSTLENTLDQKYSAATKTQTSSTERTQLQILTMASLIEREARTNDSRRIVSGILWKRLDNSWPLQVDASLQYIKGYDSATKDWWPEPLAADKQLNSPYNTYKNPGLPPGPICAPSASSIEAAINPIESEYWYYLSDLDGGMHYAKDLAEHNQNIANYLQ